MLRCCSRSASTLVRATFKETWTPSNITRRKSVRMSLPSAHFRAMSQAVQKPRNQSKEEATLMAVLRDRLGSIRRFLGDIGGSADWDSMRAQIESLQAGLEDENIWIDHTSKAMKDQTRMVRLQKQLSTYQAFEEECSQLSELTELALDSADVPMQRELLSELESLKSRSEEYLVSLWLSGPVDENSAYIEIHAGSGGTEACDFAAMLTRMYTRWANTQNYTVQIVEETPGDMAGVKSTTLLVEGPYAYGYAQYESGVHRLVRISPFDQAGARHTSFASVRVSPHFDDDGDIGIEIKPADLKITTMRSQGAGGQNVNKVESAVRIVHVPSGVVVSCQQERSQPKNRALALARLKSVLYEREVQKRAQAKNEAYETLPENAWGSQIRSYVLQPYQLVKDIRTGYETNGAQDVLDGQIQGFLEASLRKFKGTLKSS